MRLLVLAVCAMLGLTVETHAALRFCNGTDQTASIAIGYKDGDSWVSEGWWTIAPGHCAIAVGGDLARQFYYWRATNDNGAFRAGDYLFCTTPKIFTIKGDSDCKARGYEHSAFTEVNTADGPDYTVTLNEADAPQRPVNFADGDSFGKIRIHLQGLWRDSGDSAIETLINGNTLVDRFAGAAGATATWRLAKTCPGANGKGPVMLIDYSDPAGESLCWVLKGLNATELWFRPVGGSEAVFLSKVR